MKAKKSLLVKLLTLVCAICCCLSLVFGLVACGDSEAVKGIKSTTINANGELVITYTDDTTENLGVVVGKDGEKGDKGDKGDTGATGETGAQGPVGPAGPQGGTLDVECDHDMITEVARQANCVQEEVTISICTKCDGYEVVVGEKDDTVHGSYTKELVEVSEGVYVEFTVFESFGVEAGDHKAATCTEAGYSHTECSECGATISDGVIPALDHKYADGSSAYVHFKGVLENGNYCEDGEFDGYVCLICYGVYENAEDATDPMNPVYTPARGYHMADSTWEYVVEPTLTDVGSIEGVCPDCGELKTIELPELSDDTVYTKSTVQPAACDAPGTDNYTGTVSGFVVDIDVETSTKHVFNGVEIDLDVVYTEEEVELYGFDIVSNLPTATCSDEGSAVFACDICCVGLDKVYMVNFIGNHSHAADAEGVVTEPTCQEMGYTTYTCEVCGEDYKTEYTAIVAHDYEIISQVENEDQTLDITFECTMCEGQLVIEGASLVDAVEPTCLAGGEYIYEYLDPNTGLTDTVVITKAKLDYHKLAGFDTEIYLDKEYEYREIEAMVGNGLSFVANLQPATCLDTGSAVFACEVCCEEGTVLMFSVYGNHDYTGSTLNTVDSDCQEEGYTTLYCNTCEQDIVQDIIPVKAHNWVEDEAQRVDNGDGTYDLVFVCSMCGDEMDVPGATKNEDESYDATCEATGLEVYDYTDPNTNAPAKFEIVIAKSDLHTLAGFATKIDLTKEYAYSEIAAMIGNGLSFVDNVAPASCLEAGYATFKCEVCCEEGTVLMISVFADHDLGTVQTKEVSCTEDGYKYQECQVEGCDYVYIDESTRETATGHDYTNCTPELLEDGTIKFVCDVCEEPAIIDPVRVETDDASCKLPGEVRYFYDKDGDGVEDGHIAVEIPANGHDYDMTKLITFEVEIDGEAYTCQGYLCTECGEALIISMEKVAE